MSDRIVAASTPNANKKKAVPTTATVKKTVVQLAHYTDLLVKSHFL